MIYCYNQVINRLIDIELYDMFSNDNENKLKHILESLLTVCRIICVKIHVMVAYTGKKPLNINSLPYFPFRSALLVTTETLRCPKANQLLRTCQTTHRGHLVFPGKLTFETKTSFGWGYKIGFKLLHTSCRFRAPMVQDSPSGFTPWPFFKFTLSSFR
jgi:hypothetical protein